MNRAKEKNLIGVGTKSNYFRVGFAHLESDGGLATSKNFQTPSMVMGYSQRLFTPDASLDAKQAPPQSFGASAGSITNQGACPSPSGAS